MTPIEMQEQLQDVLYWEWLNASKIKALNYVQEEVLAIAEKQFQMIKEVKGEQSRKAVSRQESPDSDAEQMVASRPRHQ